MPTWHGMPNLVCPIENHGICDSSMLRNNKQIFSQMVVKHCDLPWDRIRKTSPSNPRKHLVNNRGFSVFNTGFGRFRPSPIFWKTGGDSSVIFRGFAPPEEGSPNLGFSHWFFGTLHTRKLIWHWKIHPFQYKKSFSFMGFFQPVIATFLKQTVLRIPTFFFLPRSCPPASGAAGMFGRPNVPNNADGSEIPNNHLG